jgi:hypothetical protein
VFRRFRYCFTIVTTSLEKITMFLLFAAIRAQFLLFIQPIHAESPGTAAAQSGSVAYIIPYIDRSLVAQQPRHRRWLLLKVKPN